MDYTMMAAVQLETETVYGAGSDDAAAREDAQEWADDVASLDIVRCTAAAAAYVAAHGGARSPLLVVERDGVSLASEAYAAEIGEAVDGHLLGTGQTIAADSDADAIVGEDSWQAPSDVRVNHRAWRDLCRAEIARRIERARIDAQD